MIKYSKNSTRREKLQRENKYSGKKTPNLGKILIIAGVISLVITTAGLIFFNKKNQRAGGTIQQDSMTTVTPVLENEEEICMTPTPILEEQISAEQTESPDEETIVPSEYVELSREEELAKLNIVNPDDTYPIISIFCIDIEYPNNPNRGLETIWNVAYDVNGDRKYCVVFDKANVAVIENYVSGPYEFILSQNELEMTNSFFDGGVPIRQYFLYQIPEVYSETGREVPSSKYLDYISTIDVPDLATTNISNYDLGNFYLDVVDNTARVYASDYNPDFVLSTPEPTINQSSGSNGNSNGGKDNPGIAKILRVNKYMIEKGRTM